MDPYLQLAAKLKAHTVVDEDTYRIMMSLELPIDRIAFLAALCNTLVDKQIAIVQGASTFMSKR